MKRWSVLVLVIGILAANGFSQTEGNPANWCRAGFFTEGSPEFTIAKVKPLSNKRLKKAYFRNDDRPDCPQGRGCQSARYLVPGNEVVVNGELYGFACAWFPAAKGSVTVGWLSLDDIEFQPTPTKQPLQDWIGEWKYAEGTIRFTDNKLAGWLNVTGDAYWQGLGHNIHIGEIDGRVEPKDRVAKYSDGDDEYDCKITMEILGRYLIVDDNMRCGGANVTFSGVYRKTNK
jgi:hypothetical protein